MFVREAFRLIANLDPDFISAFKISISVALCSTFLAAAIGVPLGFLIGISHFKGKRLVSLMLNTLMALPTVVVGLLGYSIMSRSGMLGEMGLLFSPVAMIIGQFVLALPIIAGLSLAATNSMDRRVWDTAVTLGSGRMMSLWLVFREGRFAYLAAIIAGFGRVFAEVGVSLMLGGNIRFYTRSITTAIAMETNKGEFSLGLALGMVLIVVALVINVLLQLLQGRASRT